MPASFTRLQRLQVDSSHILSIAALCFTLFYNQAFFRNCGAIYAGQQDGLWFLVSLGLFLFAITLLLLALLCIRALTKPLLVLMILCAAAANAFMNSYNIVVDTTMITNILKTDTREVSDLLGVKLLVEIFGLGVLPALLVGFCNIRHRSIGKAVMRRLELIGLALGLAFVAVLPFTANYTSFFREHKMLRYYTNPATPIYSSLAYLIMLGDDADSQARQSLGLDAHIPDADHSRELVILVVGEAARADHFSLNRYERETTPLLAREDVINYPNTTSCGTATAYSLPCMFSLSDRTEFDLDEAHAEENLLDVLAHAGVNVLWRDNNSDSKGVAQAIPFEDFRTAETNPVCNPECRDIGMLSGLPQYIEDHPQGDIVIVLHQMGNHGPAYFKRYPPEFEKFTPACHTSQLEQCVPQEITNAYDNAILYTDWFLSQVIQFLKAYDNRFETAMYYMGDHGESLGESGFYLHGLPYVLAPEAQKHVASLMWLGASYRADRERMLERADDQVSHDDYFHTVLGLLEIKSSVYDPEQDLVVHGSAAGQTGNG